MGWQPIETVPVKQDVLLRWECDGVRIVRMGHLIFNPPAGSPMIFRLDVDYGDAACTVYTSKDDPPVEWARIPE